QAEDGIRDLIVTGVQTCALPISTVTEARDAPVTVTVVGPLIDAPVYLSVSAIAPPVHPAPGGAAAATHAVFSTASEQIGTSQVRSEERRVGKERRSRGSHSHD